VIGGSEKAKLHRGGAETRRKARGIGRSRHRAIGGSGDRKSQSLRWASGDRKSEVVRNPESRSDSAGEGPAVHNFDWQSATTVHNLIGEAGPLASSGQALRSSNSIQPSVNQKRKRTWHLCNCVFFGLEAMLRVCKSHHYCYARFWGC
jgi:hypothetical protein